MGGKLLPEYDTDMEMHFKQEDNFTYLFGYDRDDAYGLIRVSDGHATLFVPELPPSYAVWMGTIHPPEFFRDQYGFDDCQFHQNLPAVIQSLLSEEGACLHLLDGVNSDSGLRPAPVVFEGIGDFEERTDKSVLYGELSECRVFKSEEEIEVFRYVVGHSVEAMKVMMKGTEPGLFEYDLEAIYSYEILRRAGARYTSFPPIVAGGARSATLHYFRNDMPLEDGELVCCDMGADVSGFCSDITIAYPVGGKFTEAQAAVYSTVLRANRAVQDAMGPGVSWVDMHMLATRVILEGLRDEVGVIQGATEDLIRDGLGYCFMPHGLGHFLGLTTHDVGGYNGVERPEKLGPNKLRTARVLEQGMLITVEPGVYFISALLEKYRNDEVTSGYFTEKIDEFLDFGGVRIEDDVLVTETGRECLSVGLPRTVEEIEEFLAQEE